MEQLQQLLAIRGLRLERLRVELAEKMAVLAAVDRELVVAADEVARVAQQRSAWERDWQQWLQHDRVLRRGQDFNLSHMALSAWEQDAKEIYEEVLGRRQQAATEADEVRQRLIKAEQRYQALAEQLQAWRRQQVARRAALSDARSQDEAAARIAGHRNEIGVTV